MCVGCLFFIRNLECLVQEISIDVGLVSLFKWLKGDACSFDTFSVAMYYGMLDLLKYQVFLEILN